MTQKDWTHAEEQAWLKELRAYLRQRKDLGVDKREDAKRVIALACEVERLRELLERVIDAGVTRWHEPDRNEEPLHSWLGLTQQEFAAWVECKPPFTKEGSNDSSI